jgi:CheY-like chemotaxis protein
MNMAVNARDAMPNGGNLVIETANIEIDSAAPTTFPEALPGRYVLLSVTDTGAGMDEATRQRVFEPFFTTKEVGKGTGLGLSTVYGIVKQSGGFIEVRSELGRGASFKIYLPRVDDRLPPDTESEPETDTASHGGETVLLVEDQEEVRGLVKNILTTHGYVVLEAANGAEACAVAREHSGSIHLLLTDLVMPGISGIELSERLRVSYPKLKVLLTSGYMQDFVSNRGVLERGISYLPKPFSPNELAAKIRETLAGS